MTEDGSKVSNENAQLQQLLAKVPEESLIEALAVRDKALVKKVISQEFSGPIPPPSILAGYDNVQNGFADRVVSMAEKEQLHRHELEQRAVDAEINKDLRGQRYALLISLILIAACTFLISQGHEVAGSILGGGTLTGLAYIFISGRKDGKNNSKPKS